MPQSAFANSKPPSVSRRQFIQTATAAAVVLPGAFDVRSVHGSVPEEPNIESVVGELYQSLSDAQKKEVCLGINHQKRIRVSPNGNITQPTIGGDFFQDSQRRMIEVILRNITSEDGYSRIIKQMNSDMPGGIGDYSMAFFGKPGERNFQWEMTGRHLTMRADGNNVSHASFEGPIIYGHGVEDPKRNLFYYQTKRANEVFKALDEDQASRALQQTIPGENRLKMRDFKPPYAGIGIGELADDQKRVVEAAMKVLLAPYRKEDADEVLERLISTRLFDRLHMSFYRDGDLEHDGVWDMWRIEGPGLIWHFRGAPHVHAYINFATG